MNNATAYDKILVIAAHPDDEILGSGATVKKWINSGTTAYALILAQGVTSRFSDVKGEEKEIQTKLNNLKKESNASADIIGFSELYFEDFPDNRMDSVDLLDVIQSIEKHVERIKPTIILTHHTGDLNIDHRVTFEAVITACRPLSGSSVKKLYSFQIPSSTEWHFPYHKNSFSPNTFIDVSSTIHSKIEAMKCYKSEMRKAPHPRSEDILMTIAGQWGSVANMEYAEAFELIYSIED